MGRGRWERGGDRSRGSDTSTLTRGTRSGDTGTTGEDRGTGLLGITKILGKEGGGTGISSNQRAEIRKTQN